MPEGEARNPMQAFVDAVIDTVDAPVTWFREKVVEPNRKEYPWYHQKFRRVPTIDKCYVDDQVCMFEANQQWKRDKAVDSSILSILRMRFEDCMLYEAPDHMQKCQPLMDTYNQAAENWFIKYGDLGGYANAKSCYMKQKHRLIWERRHGPVGSGMASSDDGAVSDK